MGPIETRAEAEKRYKKRRASMADSVAFMYKWDKDRLYSYSTLEKLISFLIWDNAEHTLEYGFQTLPELIKALRNEHKFINTYFPV